MNTAQQLKAKYHNQIEVGAVLEFFGACVVSAEDVRTDYEAGLYSFTFRDGSGLELSAIPKPYAGIRACAVSIN